MASSLATALVAAPYGPSPVGDVIWRNTDLNAADWIGITPSDELFDELVTILGAGEAGARLGRLVPSRRLVEHILANGPASVAIGVTANPHCTDADLALLAAGSQARVADAAQRESTERARLRTALANDERQALTTVVRSSRLELLAEILDHRPDLVALISPGDQGELLVRLAALDPVLRNRFAVACLENRDTVVTAPLVRWALGDTVGETLLALIDPVDLRRRVTDVAVGMVTEAGLLPWPKTLPEQKTASLDGMALILTPGELSALYFTSNAHVSPETRALILEKGSVDMLAVHLAGSTQRRPEPGQVRQIILGLSPERRKELCAALGVAIQDPERVLSLPWAGELALAMNTTGLRRLGLLAVGGLLETLDEMLGRRAEGWEFLLVLAEEWEHTLADLAIAAGVIEDVHV